MVNIKVALPVMLQYEKEIQAFQEAKPRIENLLETKGYKAEVGAFLYMNRNCMKPESKKAQIKNQSKYKLPLFHAQLPIGYDYSLVPNISGQKPFSYATKRNLNSATRFATTLLSHSSSDFTPSLDVHTGVFAFPESNDHNFHAGAFSIEGYISYQTLIENAAIYRFKELQKLSKKEGIELLLENEPLSNVEDSLAHKNEGPQLIFKPFGNPEIITKISGRYTTFDANHFAATLNVPERFKLNNIDSTSFFNIFGISSWRDYTQKFCNVNSYLNESTKAIHLSNTQGIGVRLEGEDKTKWGADGTSEGTLTKGQLRSFFNFGAKHNIPIALEVDYDIKNIPKNKFSEADSFLNYILS